MSYLTCFTFIGNVVLILSNVTLLLWIKREQRVLNKQRLEYLDLIRGVGTQL